MDDPHRITSIEQLQSLVGEASPMVRSKVVDTLGPSERRFIEAAPMLMMATADKEGAATVSPKGDGPGFVQVLDERTLLIPDRPGNQLAMGLRNLIDNPQLGLLFLVPGTGETLRVDGKAELSIDPELLDRMAARGKPAVLVIRVRVERCFFHCKKAFVRSGLWQPDSWQPVEFRWGEWAKERFGVDQEAADRVDAANEEDLKERL